MTNEQMQQYKDAIDKTGLAIIAITDTGECEQCKAEGKTHIDHNDVKLYHSIMDGIVYSIGFHKQGLPEIVVLAGPDGECEKSITKEQLLERVKSAAAFIEYIYQTDFVFDKNTAYESNLENNLYWVMHPEDFNNYTSELKQKLMPHTVEFYDTLDFEAVCFVPHIRALN